MARPVLAALSLLACTGMDALKLTENNWQRRTKDKVVFLKFFAPWCGHCKKMKPDWDRLMADFKGSPTGLVAEVDCTAKGKALCESHHIQSYPGLLWGKVGSLEPYTGSRTYEDMREFADEHLGTTCGPGSMDLCDDEKRALFEKFKRMPPHVLKEKIGTAEKQIKLAEHRFQAIERNMSNEIGLAEQRKRRDIDRINEENELPTIAHADGDFALTSENWDQMSKDKAVFVKFFAPWCGHCQKMKGDWEKLMLKFEGTTDALVAEVDCAGNGEDLCEKHGVEGFPRLLYGVAGQEELDKYTGPRDYESLESFAIVNFGEPCGPGSIERCEPAHQKRLEQFAQLSPEARKQKVKAKDKAIDDVEKAFQDRNFECLAQMDLAEEDMKKRIAEIKAQGLSEAKQTAAWNRKQPKDFWKPPEPQEKFLFRIFGVGVKEMDAVMVAIATISVTLAACLMLRKPSPTCDLMHILVETEEAILKVQEGLAAGEVFEELAWEFSICASKEKGGALGVRNKGTMEPEVDQICFDPESKVGEVLGPVKTKYGYHFLRINSRRGVVEAKRAKDKKAKEAEGKEAKEAEGEDAKEAKEAKEAEGEEAEEAKEAEGETETKKDQ